MRRCPMPLTQDEQDLKRRAALHGYKLRLMRYEHDVTEYRLVRRDRRQAFAGSDLGALNARLETATRSAPAGR
jgi:hypothetical protein